MGHAAGHPALGEPLDDLQGPRGEPRQRVLAQHRSSWLAPPHPPSPTHDAMTAPVVAPALYALLKGRNIPCLPISPRSSQSVRSSTLSSRPDPGTWGSPSW